VQHKSPAFQLDPGDWLCSENIRAMTPAQEGAYIRLLCYAWLNDYSLPADERALAKLSRLGRSWVKNRAEILKNFEEIDGRLVNDWLLQERAKQEKRRAKLSQKPTGREVRECLRKLAEGSDR
jgi:uncharacterized protein YdaU (DUF1376 family)